MTNGCDRGRNCRARLGQFCRRRRDPVQHATGSLTTSDYRFRLTSSWSISSLVVMTRAFD